jgi:chromosome segregation ATPase
MVVTVSLSVRPACADSAQLQQALQQYEARISDLTSQLSTKLAGFQTARQDQQEKLKDALAQQQADQLAHKPSVILAQDAALIANQKALLQQIASKLKQGRSLNAQLLAVHGQNRKLLAQIKQQIQQELRAQQHEQSGSSSQTLVRLAAMEQKLALQLHNVQARATQDTARLQAASLQRSSPARISQLQTRCAADQQQIQSLQQRLTAIQAKQTELTLAQASKSASGGSSGSSGVVGAITTVGQDAVNQVGSTVDQLGSGIASLF